MTDFVNEITGNTSIDLVLKLFLRIIIACICGAAVGTERSKRLKEAGIRTHCVVACAAAVFMILSKYCFADLTVDSSGTIFAGDRGADPARIAAQVVSGLGFLGAGVIFKNGSSIKGLTTAAGLWATAAIGMAIGSGMLLIGIFTTLILVILQILTHRFTIGNDSYVTSRLVIVAKNTKDFHDWLLSRLKSGIQVTDSSITRNENDTVTYHLTVRMTKSPEFTQLMALLDEKEDIISISHITE